MSVTRVFITAAGTSRRFGNGVLKQLLPINEVPLIRRLINQLKDYNCEIYILTWHKQLMFNDVNIIDTVTRPRELADTILLSKPYWRDKNVVLVGDAIFGERTLWKIMESGRYPTIFGRTSCPAKLSSERFALVFNGEHTEYITSTLQKASRIFGEDGKEGHGGMLKICYATKPDWLCKLSNCTKLETPLYPVIRPFRDFVCCHLLPRNRWLPEEPMKFCHVTDNITTDIDTPEEYQHIIEHGVPE